MARFVTIADEHSRQRPKQFMTIELEGGDPWFAHIWINDECYCISRYDTDAGNGFKIEPR